MSDFNEDEIEALKKVAREKMAYDTITQKFKNTWVWGVGAGILAVWALWDKIALLFTGVK